MFGLMIKYFSTNTLCITWTKDQESDKKIVSENFSLIHFLLPLPSYAFTFNYRTKQVLRQLYATKNSNFQQFPMKSIF